MSWVLRVDAAGDLDWERIRAALPEVDSLIGCMQEPVFHGEGDVSVHTQMVVAALGEDERFWTLPAATRGELATAAALHDLGKPSTTRVEDGRIRQPGHARRGEILSRVALWERGVPVEVRERIANLVRFHLAPFHLLDADRPIERLFHASWACGGLDSLVLLARADASGRISATRDELVERVELTRLLADEHDVVRAPFAFGSDRARVEWFRRPERDPAFTPFEEAGFEVTVMSGLPASGKDHWIGEHAAHLPVVSLDQLRVELGVDPRGSQGGVVAAAREQARIHLRAGRPFVWNATNLSRRTRGNVVALCLDYGANVRIVAVETSADELDRRNAERAHPVPGAALDRMIAHWEFPDPTEAHRVEVAASHG